MQREKLAYRAWCVPAAALALVLAGTLAVSRPARADVDVRFDVGNAPAAPNLYFRTEPHRVYDSTAGVYVIDDPELGDYDAFEYGGSVWLFSDGFWYQAPSWDADFTVVSPSDVPREVYDVPTYRWHHHPSYDSVYLQGRHPREWGGVRTQVGVRTQSTDWRNRDRWNRDDYDRDVHVNDSQYRARVYGDADYDTSVRHHHRHHHDVGIGVSVGVHRTHHHHHVDRDDRYRRDDRDDRDDR